MYYVIIILMISIIYLYWQDCCVTIPPEAFFNGDNRDDVILERDLDNFDKLWIIRLQCLFEITVHPIGDSKKESCFDMTLAYFSLFMPLDLGLPDRLQRVYEPEPIPLVYVGYAKDILGRIPLMPSFLSGTSNPTIPNMYAKKKNSKFAFGSVDAASANHTTRGNRPGAPKKKLGSNVYEVGDLMWKYARIRPRRVGHSVEEEWEVTEATATAGYVVAQETRKRRREKRAHK